GDHTDLIQMRVTNLSPQSPHNYREFNVTLFCDGMGMDALRWGIPTNPTLGCGSTIRAPFLYTANGDGYNFTVTLPQDNVFNVDFTSQLAARYVRYTLLATVAA
ncbi:MAG: hypothetical protein H7175_24705, partial [Burkholderiales bacterium]|nr:hypothetical protein [Anaerolineae bacterium]